MRRAARLYISCHCEVPLTYHVRRIRVITSLALVHTVLVNLTS